MVIHQLCSEFTHKGMLTDFLDTVNVTALKRLMNVNNDFFGRHLSQKNKHWISVVLSAEMWPSLNY